MTFGSLLGVKELRPPWLSNKKQNLSNGQLFGENDLLQYRGTTPK
jgi:hypothetical protein